MNTNLFNKNSLFPDFSITPSLAPDCDCYSSDIQNQVVSSVPSFYSLELTPVCNNRCPGCGNVFIDAPRARGTNGKSLSPRILRINAWERILDTIAPHAHRLSITGGEPTLHPDFALIIAALEQRGIPFTLFSNGRWSDPSCLIELLGQAPHCSGVLISLHGADADAHEAFSGVPGSFAETVQHIRLAAQAGIRVQTNTVLTRNNAHQIEAIVHLAQSLGAERAVFNRAIGVFPEHLDLPPDDLFLVLQRVDQIGCQTNFTKIGSCVPQCFVASSATGCQAGTAFCTIDPWGNVRPCNHAPQIVGNVFDEPLETIWKSPVLDSWRNLGTNECMGCDMIAACGGGCRADVIIKGTRRDSLIPEGLSPALS
jgi:radical SAM protein with 4Fe4S-binding SPASM domain